MEISILGMNYAVELYDGLAREETALGTCTSDALLIRIDKSLKPDKHNKTVFHEIIHAALFELQNDKAARDEKMVDNIALALYQTLRDCGALNMDSLLLKNPSRV